MTFQTVDLHIAERVATLTLNRPDRLNAISQEMRSELRQLGSELARDQRVRVVVITGAGRAFCVGADVGLFEQRIQEEWPTAAFRANTRTLTDFYDTLEAMEKPVVAAINGVCVGGGLEMALSCDIRVAVETATFGFPENNIGLIPGVGGCSRLVKLVGYGKAKEMVMTGEIIPAQEAHRIGLVQRLAPEGQLQGAVAEVVERLLSRAPLAVGVAKRVLHACVDADLATGRLIESLAQSDLLHSEDHRRGLQAFRHKERAQFQGR